MPSTEVMLSYRTLIVDISIGHLAPIKGLLQIQLLYTSAVLGRSLVMFFQIFHITSCIFVLSMIPFARSGSLLTNEFECMLKDISLRLSIGSEILASVRKDLPKDIKGFCRMNPCAEGPFNCSDWKRCPRRMEPINCSECRDCSCEQQQFKCSECYKCPQEEKPIDCRKCPCLEKPVSCSECKKAKSDMKPADCSDIYRKGFHRDGVYEVWPRSRVSKGPLHVYCDMKDGGGWMVIQRRGDFANSEYFFYQDWKDYKKGFGNILKEFWIGNDNLFALTNQRSYQIRFDLTDWERNFAYATYDEFWVDDEFHDYMLHVKGYNGTAGDSFSSHDGNKFTTKDKDNDSLLLGNSAIHYKGAWWYHNCLSSNLNGLHLKGRRSTVSGITWSAFKDTQYSLKETVMKIRPTDFRP